VLGRVYFARQASALLRYARSTNNPELAAALIEQAVNLKDRIDAVDRPMPSPRAPDVETEIVSDGSAAQESAARLPQPPSSFSPRADSE
jgi:hypothetical protein